MRRLRSVVTRGVTEGSGMSPVAIRIWLLLGTMSVADVFWCAGQGLVVTDWRPFAVLAAALLGLGQLTRRTGRLSWLGRVAEWTLLWLIFSVAGAILTYAAATRGGALRDQQLAALDRALGFDWNDWVAFVNSIPAFKTVLWACYNSLFAQIMLSVAWFTWVGWPQRNAEL